MDESEAFTINEIGCEKEKGRKDNFSSSTRYSTTSHSLELELKWCCFSFQSHPLSGRHSDVLKIWFLDLPTPHTQDQWKMKLLLVLLNSFLVWARVSGSCSAPTSDLSQLLVRSQILVKAVVVTIQPDHTAVIQIQQFFKGMNGKIIERKC